MSDPALTVGIIGAGLSGITMALALKQQGFHNFVIYERDDAVGGTWYNNAYPGCRCDVTAIWYSHSRFPKPDWTEQFPPRAEILAYWQKIAKDEDILKHIRFHHNLVYAKWQPSTNNYAMRFKHDGQEIVVAHNVMISAVGGFSKPRLPPDVEGLDTFKGQVFHSGKWAAEVTVDTLRGKTIGVIGNGCSGTQIVATLANEPDINIIAIARSPQWLLPTSRPGPQSKLAVPKWKQKLFSIFPIMTYLFRFLVYLRMEMNWMIFPLAGGWIRNMLTKTVSKFMRAVAPPHLKDKIVPTYPLGSKRLILDGGYLKSLNKPNVTAVWDSLKSVNGHTITTVQGQTFDLDYLVLATGFDLLGTYLPVEGRTSEMSYVVGKDGGNTYHGMAIPGFPNLFYLLGVNSAPTHASAIFMIEVQANYVAKCVAAMVKKSIATLEIKQEATNKYMKWLDARLEKIIWVKTESWYRADAGTGRIFPNWPGPVTLFWYINRKVQWKDWIGGEKL